MIFFLCNELRSNFLLNPHELQLICIKKIIYKLIDFKYYLRFVCDKNTLSFEKVLKGKTSVAK